MTSHLHGDNRTYRTHTVTLRMKRHIFFLSAEHPYSHHVLHPVLILTELQVSNTVKQLSQMMGDLSKIIQLSDSYLADQEILLTVIHVVQERK